MARFLYYFGIIMFFSLVYSLYSNGFIESGSPIANITGSDMAKDYLNKTYSWTIPLMAVFGPFIVALEIVFDMFKVMVFPSMILADLGIPGSDVLGLVLNVIFWIVMAGALIEIVTRVRGV